MGAFADLNNSPHTADMKKAPAASPGLEQSKLSPDQAMRCLFTCSLMPERMARAILC